MAKRMTKKERERVGRIMQLLDDEYGTEHRCYLNHNNAWQLLIATILSAQCTDARVNIVTKDLFVKYPTLEAFANAEQEELEIKTFPLITLAVFLPTPARETRSYTESGTSELNSVISLLVHAIIFFALFL